MLPKVSIIMPTHNRAAFIEESIESIRQQTYAAWELLVVDDGSDDNTEDVVRNLNDERIQFYKLPRTGIGGKVKNLGLQNASGDFVAFLDSDDLWAPTKIEKQMALLNQFPQAGFSLTGGYNFKTLHEPFEFFYKKTSGIKHDRLFFSFFQSEVPGFTQALLFRKECLRKTGWFREVKAFSDVDFIATLAYHFSGVVLYEPLVFRRLHDRSYSNPNWIRSYHEGAQLIHDFKDKLPRSLFRAALFKLYIHFGEDFLKGQERNEAIKQFSNAWKYRPFSMVPLKKMGKAVLPFLRRK
jgi:glycosyltransferase involved in cell wall biosynthesis